MRDALLGSWPVLALIGLLLIGLLLWRHMFRRWRRSLDVTDDAAYSDTLRMLSEGSVRRSFNPYTDIDWAAPETAVRDDDERWVLTDNDTLGRHRWYREQPLDRRIAMGRYRQAHLAKVSLELESLLIRGLVQYSFWLPNGSPEYRYCLHEAVEECHHSLMFQELVNRIGADVPGMPRLLRWVTPLLPLAAGPLPNAFFFGVLAGEVPIDHRQKSMLRDTGELHPLVETVMAVHVAEEARHISFADAYLRKRVPRISAVSRLCLSLYVPLVMRLLCLSVLPPRRFFTEFGVPFSVRRDVCFGSPDARLAMREIFADIRMLCDDIGLMNPPARLVWRLCRIDGRPSRYRGEPARGDVSPSSVS